MNSFFVDCAESFFIFPWLFTVVWAWVGACIGSFLNVCIWRIPNGMSLVHPPSHCPKCEHPIPFYENIPVFSWFFLRGKCSSCHERISFRYPFVEFLTAVTFLAVWLVYPYFQLLPEFAVFPTLLLHFTAASILIASAFTDCDYKIVPDEFVITLLIADILHVFCIWEHFAEYHGLTLKSFAILGRIAAAELLPAVLVACLLAGLAMLGHAILHKTALGWGDVKLLAVLVPVLSIVPFLVGLLAACVLAVLFAPLYRKLKPKYRHRALPFVPFIAVGMAASFFFFAIYPDAVFPF